jgi:hypothetical protein
MEVTGLTPGKEYKFRVAAVNSEGESEPLEADQTIVAKNPFGKEMCTVDFFIGQYLVKLLSGHFKSLCFISYR